MVPVTMVVMVVTMMVVTMPPVMMMMVMEVRTGVVALLDPSPAVPDRTTDQRNGLGFSPSGNAGEWSGRKGLGGSAGKRSRECHHGSEHQTTHFEIPSHSDAAETAAA